MKGFSLSALALALPIAAQAAEKGTQFWNLAAKTVTHLQLAPAGTQSFGADQARNDPDGTVDPDERVKVTGIESGTYDAKVTYKGDRTCVVKGLKVDKGKVFSIDDKALTDCAR